MMGIIKASLICILAATTVAFTFPLDSAYSRGDSCLNIVWTPDSANTKPTWYIQNGSLCTGVDTVYRHCDFTPGVTYRSIAYSYGGEDPYLTFRDKLRRGLLAGSHLCHYQTVGDPSPYVAGTDCSGFACYLWNVPRVSTNGLVSDPQYQKIQKSDLRAGDLLVRAGSHAVFVVDQDDSTHFVIWESTSAVNGCRERVIDITDAAWAPYVAVRNPGITPVQNAVLSAGAAVPFLGGATVGKESAKISLRFNRPFKGDVDLYGLNGERIKKSRIDCGAGRCEWEFPHALSGGIYVIGLRSTGRESESRTFVVMK
jgi:hypothetical protein